MSSGIINSYILGIDEVGRGALAGPVTLAGVAIPTSWPLETNFYNPKDFEKIINVRIFDNNSELSRNLKKTLSIVRDSKKLNQTKRELVARIVNQNPHLFNHFIVSCSNQLIDQFGIGVCLSHLVALVILEIGNIKTLSQIIIDGKIKILEVLNSNLCQLILTENKLDPNLFCKWSNFAASQRQLITGENYADDKYLNVALASNIAKVWRDNYMIQLSPTFPKYNWLKNKGYGTAQNREAIVIDPNNEFLRQSFLKKILGS